MQAHTDVMSRDFASVPRRDRSLLMIVHDDPRAQSALCVVAHYSINGKGRVGDPPGTRKIMVSRLLMIRCRGSSGQNARIGSEQVIILKFDVIQQNGLRGLN